jgi:hypothetical protein
MFEKMRDNYNKEDQTSLNNNIHLVNYKFLSRKFFTIGQLIGGVWDEQDFNLPKNILTHHANWVVGIDNKIKLLDIVRKKYESI